MAAEMSRCRHCKLPSPAICRSLCETCLNKNLQRACQKTIVLAPRVGRCATRAFFPGMPRAVLGPSKQGNYCRSGITAANASPSLSAVAFLNRGREATASSTHEVWEDSLSCQLESSGVHDPRDGSGEHERSRNTGVHDPNDRSGEQERSRVPNYSDSVPSGFEGKGAAVADKWHLFQIRKNLTVRIPNPLVEVSDRPNQRQPKASLPAHTETYAKNSRAFKRWAVKPDPNAEAELMMRLLADSGPMLKPTALVLPPCKVRPAPISPLSPPGDPLWKRRCIPCPQSLRLQVLPVCVR